MDDEAIEWVTERVVAALACGTRVGPVALTFLLRRYVAAARPEIGELLEPALACALDEWPACGLAERAAWLVLFAEALDLSDDERLTAAAADLAATLAADASVAGSVADCSVAVEARLRSAHLSVSPTLVRDAVDELERVVSAAYRPGEGMRHAIDPGDRQAGTLADHVGPASALLTAFRVTARLPYAMLAEELMQFARRTRWDDAAGGFFDRPGGADKPFGANCGAVRLLCRLEALDRDREYRTIASLGAAVQYGRDAARTLALLRSSADRQDLTMSAAYGVALGEWLDRTW